MSSSATYTSLKARVLNLLMDSGAALWADAQAQEGFRLALEFYSIKHPRRAIGTYTLVAASREIPLASFTGLQAVERIWFPYNASDDPRDPDWVNFEVWDNDGTLTAFLGEGRFANGETNDPAISDVARIFYHKLHTLNGLDSATATTFDARDEGTLVIGAAGYMCLMRSTELNETASNMAVSTPNYAALAGQFLIEFRERLEPRTPTAAIADIIGEV